MMLEQKKSPLLDLASFYESQFNRAANTQAEHSKWLINTLYLLQSGAIAGIVARAPTNLLPTFATSLLLFAIGLVLAFIAGFVTWANYYFALMAYADIIKSIHLGSYSGQRPKSVRWASFTQTLAFLLGGVSLILLILGAWIAYSTLVKLPA